MAHLFLVRDRQVNYLELLYKNRKDNQYYVLNSNNGYSDIAQYSEKYDCVAIKTVRSENLDKSKELVAY